MAMTNSLIPTTLCSRRWTYRFHCAGMNPPFSSRTDGQLPSGASAVKPKPDDFASAPSVHTRRTA
jgi:hypothetical protein